MPQPPQLLLLLSGKRKSGKDFLAEHILKHIGPDKCQIIRISEPIKAHWAQRKGLNLAQLLGDGPYKERYRREMIEWSEAVRAAEPAFFCREAMKKASKPIVIVSDIRRRTDVAYFRSLRPAVRMRTVRVQVDDMVRVRRGWTFEQGVDDVPSECDLDAVQDWDIVVRNEAMGEQMVNAQLAEVWKAVQEEAAAAVAKID